jgi:hypothetical protein
MPPSRGERRFMMQPVENANVITTMFNPRLSMLAVVIAKFAFRSYFTLLI